MTLRNKLLHADESERPLIENLLRHACGLPREPGLRRLADAVRARVGVHPHRPGETPIVAVTGTQASLWLLQPRAGGIEFIDDARAALGLAEQRVSRDLPLLFEPGALPESWSAERLVAKSEKSLGGSSFGLSFCLAFASLLIDRALPTDLIATAAVSPDGELEGVDEATLVHKLRLIQDFAPGIRKVLVASVNGDCAEHVAAELDGCFEIVRADSLHAALETAFPNLSAELEARFDDEQKRRHAARRLFELVRDGSSSLLSWRGVVASCQWLSDRLPAGSSARMEARFAEAVARRHAGEELPCPLDIEWVEGMPRPLRLRVLAHLIEHSRFHESDERRAIRDLAEAALPPRSLDDYPEDLTVLGALARSYAVFREHEAAERCLRRALRGWRELGLIERSSFALSEWIRILGLASRLAELRRVSSRASRAAPADALDGIALELLESPQASALSRSFVRFALGRAFVQAGDLVEARRFLDDMAEHSWSLTPAHLQASRLRWWAQLLALSGEGERARQARATLAALAESAPEAEFAAALSDIDAALSEDRDASSALERLRRIEPIAVSHVESEGKTWNARELARQVATHYPY